MISNKDLEHLAGAGFGMNKTALSNPGLGALGGAGLGLLVQALRPKDKDQSAWKEYLMSALLGAGLGTAAGYGYDTLFGGESQAGGTPGVESVTPKTRDGFNPILPPEEKAKYQSPAHAYKRWYDLNTDHGRRNQAAVAADIEECKKRGVEFIGTGDTCVLCPFEDVYGDLPLDQNGNLIEGQPFYVRHSALSNPVFKTGTWNSGMYGLDRAFENREAAIYFNGCVYPMVGYVYDSTPYLTPDYSEILWKKAE